MTWFTTFLLSMVPVIEMRGAIPYGVAHGLNYWQAYCAAILGSFFITAVILALLIPVFKLLRKLRLFTRFVNYFENKFTHAANRHKHSHLRAYIFIFLLVFFPVPLTGVWTVAAIAIFMNLPYFKSLFVICMGAAGCGLLMIGITLWFGQYAEYIFYFFAVVAAITITLIIIAVLFKNQPNKLK